MEAQEGVVATVGAGAGFGGCGGISGTVPPLFAGVRGVLVADCLLTSEPFLPFFLSQVPLLGGTEP